MMNCQASAAAEYCEGSYVAAAAVQGSDEGAQSRVSRAEKREEKGQPEAAIWAG